MILMLKSFVDRLNGTDSAVNWLRGAFPDEEIVFLSAATVLETKSIAPAKWYQRVFERQVTLMLTKNQLALKNSLISRITILYSVWAIILLILYILDKDWGTLILIMMPLLLLLQYLPYQRQILYKDIRKILLNPMGGARTELVVDITEKVIHTVFAQTLPPKALKIITSRAKTTISS